MRSAIVVIAFQAGTALRVVPCPRSKVCQLPERQNSGMAKKYDTEIAKDIITKSYIITFSNSLLRNFIKGLSSSSIIMSNDIPR